ncbi:energy transducer TonB [Flavipsychrobacter stenotrophus]|nr:energy transducer TonB [Flavipsychrobacter stenotrophus]
MDAKKLLEADYLDIIYDHRNKGYGGYELRKNYSSRVRKGVGFLMLGLSAIVSFSFVRMEKPITSITVTTTVTPHIIEVERKEKPPVVPPKKAETPPPAKSKIITPPVITDKEIEPDKQMTRNEDMKNFNPGKANVDSGADGLNPPIAGNNPGGPVVVAAANVPAIPVFVEQMPAFPGDMQSYLSKNINYPPNAREAGIQGRVAITFVVNEDGSITNAKVTHSLGAGCDEEALRVIKAMPKWKAGKNNGVATKVMFTQAISFKLE